MFKLTVILIVLFFLFRKKISSFVKREKLGAQGEKEVASYLRNLPYEYRVVNHFTIDHKQKTAQLEYRKNNTSQIDHAVISRYGIFVIETKNIAGSIYGQENAENWIQYLHNKRHSFHNPLKQNVSHLIALEKYLKIDREKLIPLVVFTNRSILKVTTSQNVIKSSDLISFIQSYDKILLTEDETNLAYSKILLCDTFIGNLIGKFKIIQNQKEKQQRLEQGLCPKCGGKLKKRTGKYGEFFGCINYPRCRYKKTC